MAILTAVDTQPQWRGSSSYRACGVGIYQRTPHVLYEDAVLVVATPSRRLCSGRQLWNELSVVMYAGGLDNQVDHSEIWRHQAIQAGRSIVPGPGAGRTLHRSYMDNYRPRPENAQILPVLDQIMPVFVPVPTIQTASTNPQ